VSQVLKGDRRVTHSASLIELELLQRVAALGLLPTMKKCTCRTHRLRDWHLVKYAIQALLLDSSLEESTQ
jgi:hypothetical protein